MVNLFFHLVAFLFGLAVGSFLNCLIYRLENNQSFLKGRSFCPRCRHNLSWPDLVPILSFLSLGGRCRYCKKSISWQYPLVELGTGLLFLFIFSFHLAIFHYLIVPFLVVIFVYDLKHYLIPDKIIYPAILLAFFCDALFNFPDLTLGYLPAALAAAAFFLAIIFLSRGKWLGWGDVKLAFLMGLILGWPNILLALFLGFATGAIIGVGLIAAGKKSLKSAVPFGPFLVTGTLLTLFWGGAVINWYLSLFR